jgi:DNA replication protein DnaC
MANIASLPVLLKMLRLSVIAKAWESVATKAIDDQWSHQQYLAELCDREVAERYRKKIQRFIRESQLPPGKSLSGFDFTELQSLTPQQIQALCNDTGWTQRAENVLFFGPSGLGKSHLACAIGYALIERGVRVKFSPATLLVQHLQKAREELGLVEALTRLDKFAVLILDDIGYVKRSERETQVLFELIAHRYETGSMIITSNQPFSAWDRIFDDNMMTVAAIDRLVHHATVLECRGEESYRKKTSIERAKKKTNV